MRWDMEPRSSDFMVDDDDGAGKLLSFIRHRLHITDLSLETDAFENFFTHLALKKGKTLMKYINVEDTSYRRLQRVLEDAEEDGEEEYSDEDGTLHVKRFQLPKRLCGWYFMECVSIPTTQHSGILNMIGVWSLTN